MPRLTRLLFLCGLLALTAAHAARAADPIYTRPLRSLALDGHDPVAYFERGRPVPGTAEIQTSWSGATWRFASEENRAAFLADPTAYAPQYGGYCAWAVSQGKLAPGNPENWSIVGGKLYVNYDAAVQRRWTAGQEGFIEQADRRWPALLAND